MNEKFGPKTEQKIIIILYQLNLQFSNSEPDDNIVTHSVTKKNYMIH